jgi:SAM-dependent methyltransferase
VSTDPDRPAAAGGASDCCRPSADPRIARHFDAKMAELATRAAMPPMRDVSRGLLDALSFELAEHEPSLLEVGCGSGALTVALLEHGATTATGVDLSPASLEAARRRAAAAGMSERTRFEVGDGASIGLSPHDWVVLDRVLCCYADLDRLLRNSMVAARRRFAFSVPISSGWRGLVNRAIVSMENATNSLRGRPCPGFVHDVRRIEARLGAAGFHKTRTARQGLWYVAVFDRV